MRVFGPDGLLADELGGQVFVFGGNFLADFASRFLTSAANLVIGFEHHTLHFQLNRRQRMPAPTRLLFECFLAWGGSSGSRTSWLTGGGRCACSCRSPATCRNCSSCSGLSLSAFGLNSCRLSSAICARASASNCCCRPSSCSCCASWSRCWRTSSCSWLAYSINSAGASVNCCSSSWRVFTPPAPPEIGAATHRDKCL